MATVAARRNRLLRVGALAGGMPAMLVLLAVLVGVSLLVRSRGIGTALWIDEGLSIGIASHPFTDIPSLLRQDGSPPLYYLLLHIWMEIAGRSEAQAQALSLIFGLLAVPAALWAGWSLFGRRVGWICALLAALNPMLTAHSAEARMYPLLSLLGILATAAALHAFAFRRRRYLPLFAGLLALMLYTHNWSAFFAAGTAIALLVCLRDAADRRRLAYDGLLAFGGAVLLFAPWVPTLIYQTLHTGAPWSTEPSPRALILAAVAVLGGGATATALVLAGGSGIAASFRTRAGQERTAILAVVSIAAGTLVSAWLFSQLSPAWAFRYLSVALGPFLLPAAVGLGRAGRLGMVALAIVAALWAYPRPVIRESRSSEKAVLRELAPLLRPGDTVLSTHPERVPIIHYYLPPGMRYVTPLGPVVDPGVMDWRDALPRLQSASIGDDLAPLLDKVPEGGRILLVRPLVTDGPSWTAPWTRLVRRRSRQWALALAADGRFTPAAASPRSYIRLTAGVRAVLYRKVRAD